MRANACRATSTTGGTGALTLSAVTGFTSPLAVFPTGVFVQYAILEGTDSTFATPSKLETGVGYINGSNALVRSAVRSTLSSGTYNNSTATALSFGTSNVRVDFAPLAEDRGVWKLTSFAHGQGPSNFTSSTSNSSLTLTAARLYAIPVEIEAAWPIGSLGVATSSTVNTTVNLAIATIDPTDGLPDVVIASVNALSVNATNNIYGSVAAPIFIPPGDYWALIYSPGAPVLRGVSPNTLRFGASGGAGFGDLSLKYLTQTITGGSREFTVGSDALTNLTGGSWAGTNNAVTPMIFWKP
jgi:hypothetical protein